MERCKGVFADNEKVLQVLSDTQTKLNELISADVIALAKHYEDVSKELATIEDTMEINKQLLREFEDSIEDMKFEHEQLLSAIMEARGQVEGLEPVRPVKSIPRSKPTGIVRCKDCAWSRLRTGYTDRYVCTRWNNTTGKNEFCSYSYK